MFKNLKKKLEQGVAQSKAAVSAISSKQADDGEDKNVSQDSIGKPVAESTPQKNDAQKEQNARNVSRGNFSVSDVPTGQLVDIPLSEGPDNSHYETASDISSVKGNETPRGNRSRTSSISSMASESTFFPTLHLSHNYYQPSDAESEIEDTSASFDLSSITKEELFAIFKRFERRAFKYKSKFMELASAYKDMIQEREKLKTTMAQCQDRAFRRMSELREQIQLDQLAKRDLEENYRLLLDEKDEYMKVLQTQIKLLKEGKDIPEELQVKINSKQVKAEATPPPSQAGKNISTSEEIELLKSKINRQDGLLQKCKDTITSYKDKVTVLSTDKQELIRKLEGAGQGGSTTIAPTADITKLQVQIKEARKIIEQLETDREVAIASVKQQVHEEMEKKDAELEQLKSQMSAGSFTEENTKLKLDAEKMLNEIDDLKKTNQEQLMKAREIIKKLKEEKKLAVHQAEETIRNAEANMEEEKEKMIAELKRGKGEALAVIQEQMEQQHAEKLSTALEEKDRMWNEKMASLVAVQQEEIFTKERAVTTLQEDIQQKIKEKEQEMQLALEERELQKMAAVTGMDEQKDELLRKIEGLKSEKIEHENKFVKFHEDSEQQMSELKEKIVTLEREHQTVVNQLQTSHNVSLQEEKTLMNSENDNQQELLIQRHAEELEALKSKHEEVLQETSIEAENLHKAEVESLRTEHDRLLESIKVKHEKMLSDTALHQEESQKTFVQTQTKLAEVEQLLSSAEDKIASMNKEHESQMQELHAAINGKGSDNDLLQTQIKDWSDKYDSVKAELKETAEKLVTLNEENNRLKEQVEFSKGETEGEINDLFKEREELHSRNQVLDSEKKDLEDRLKSQEELWQEQKSQVLILSEELSASYKELDTLRNESALLKANKEKVNVDMKQKLSELTDTMEKKDEQLATTVQTSEEIIQQLQEKCESQEKEMEIKEIRIGEMENIIKEKAEEGDEVLSKREELEKEVNHLKDIIQSLESCQERIQMEKASLEEKLTMLEDIVDDLKKSKEEMNEKLDQHQNALVQQITDEKQALETRVSELVSQEDDLQEQLRSLEKSLVSKDDEIIAIRSVMEDNTTYVKSIEQQREQLTTELQQKNEKIEETDLKLTQSLEKFEKLRAEANAKIKGLKDIKDSLTEQVGQKEQELQDKVSSLNKEKEELVLKHEEILAARNEETKSLEESFKTKFEEKQSKFKEAMTKLRDRYDEKLKAKDTEFESRINELTSQNQLGVEDVSKNFERLKEDQMKELEEKHTTSMKETIREWENKLSAASEIHSQQVQSIKEDLEQQLSASEIRASETEQKFVEEVGSLKSSLEIKQKEFEELQNQSQIYSNKHKEEVDNLTASLTQKDDTITELKNSLQSSEEKYKENTDSEIRLKSLLEEKERQLESMASTISAEQESLQKQLTVELGCKEKLHQQLTSVSEELKNIQEKHSLELQEKDSVLCEKSEKVSQLQMEYSSMEEMLKATNDSLQEKLSEMKALQETVEVLQTEKSVMITDKEKEDKERQGELSQLKEELESLRTHKETEISDLKMNKEEVLAKLEEEQMKYQRLESSLNEQINILKEQLHDSQNQAELSSSEMQTSLQQRIKEGDEKLLTQIENHQQVMEKLQQEGEQKVKDLKQKFVIKMKEVQGQGKATIEQLEEKLKSEKKEREEIYHELTRANTRLLQMEESTGLSKDTIVDLENKVKAFTSDIGHRDHEISEIKKDSLEKEKNLQQIVEETHMNCQEMSSKLNEAEKILKEKEIGFEEVNSNLNSSLQELSGVKALIDEKDAQISSLQIQNGSLMESFGSEKNSLQQSLQEQKEKCLQMESVLEKTNKLLEEAQNQKIELEYKVQSADRTHSELEEKHKEKSDLENQLALAKENSQSLEKCKLDLEKSLQDSTSQTETLQKELEDVKSQMEKEKQDLQNQLHQLKESHNAEVEELTTKMDSQSSTKVADYKKKAETYISQMKKQLQGDKDAMEAQLKEKITNLEETISGLNLQVKDLSQEKEKLSSDHQQQLKDIDTHHVEEIKGKASVIKEKEENERHHIQTELSLNERLTGLTDENASLVEKLSDVEKQSEKSKYQYENQIEELKSSVKKVEDFAKSSKSDYDDRLAEMEKDVSYRIEAAEKTCKATLDKQESDHARKVKQLVKDMNRQLAVKEKEFEDMFAAAVDKGERGEQGLMKAHENDLEEIRKEIKERDDKIDDLHLDYKGKLETLEKTMGEKIELLQKELTTVKQEHQQELLSLDMQKKSSVKESMHQEKAATLSSEWNKERQNVMLQPVEVVEEMMCQSQSSVQSAPPSGGVGNDYSLRRQVVDLTQQIEQMKEQHKHEMANVQASMKMAARPHGLDFMDPNDPNMAVEFQNLELHNMDLQAQVSQMSGELGQHKIRERELQRKLDEFERSGRHHSKDDDPPLSLDGSYLNHDDSAVFREPTEFEYLKNILYEYMMGKETKTLAKVIATVVRFSEEQTRNVLAKTEPKLI